MKFNLIDGLHRVASSQKVLHNNVNSCPGNEKAVEAFGTYDAAGNHVALSAFSIHAARQLFVLLYDLQVAAQ